MFIVNDVCELAIAIAYCIVSYSFSSIVGRFFGQGNHPGFGSAGFGSGEEHTADHADCAIFQWKILSCSFEPCTGRKAPNPIAQICKGSLPISHLRKDYEVFQLLEYVFPTFQRQELLVSLAATYCIGHCYS